MSFKGADVEGVDTRHEKSESARLPHYCIEAQSSMQSPFTASGSAGAGSPVRGESCSIAQGITQKV